MVTKVNYLTFVFFAVFNSIVAASLGSCPAVSTDEGQETITYNYPYGNSKLMLNAQFMVLEYSSYGVYDGSDDKYTKLTVSYFYVKTSKTETVAFGSLVSQSSALIQIGSAQAFPCSEDNLDLISNQYTYFDYSLEGIKVTSVGVELEAGLYYPVKWISVEWNDDGQVYPAWDSANVRAYKPKKAKASERITQSSQHSSLVTTTKWSNSSSTLTSLKGTNFLSSIAATCTSINETSSTATTNPIINGSVSIETYSPQKTQIVNGNVVSVSGSTKLLPRLVVLVAFMTSILIVV